MAKFDTLYDTFGATLNSALWATWGSPPPTTSGGDLVITSTHTYTGVNTQVDYDLSNSSIQVQTDIPLADGIRDVTGTHEASHRLYNPSESFQIEVMKSGPQLFFHYTINGGTTWTDLAGSPVAFSAANHRYVRFRNATGTTVIIETSSDGVTWSSASGRGGSFDPAQSLTTLSLELSAGWWWSVVGEDESAATWTIAQVGLPAVTHLPIISSLSGVNDVDKTTLSGTVNPNTLPTQYWFEYGSTPSYGRTTLKLNAGNGSSVSAQSVIGPPTTYDALVAKQRDRLHWFIAWLGLNGAAQGYIGEVGWPGTTGFTWVAPETPDLRYNVIGRYMLDRYRETGFYVTPWASGDNWGAYALLTHGRVVSSSIVNGVANTLFEPGKVIEAVAPDFAANHMGVNMAGAEFGFPEDGASPFNNSSVGTYGSDYLYPSLGTMQFAAAHGVKVVRIPIRWERIQRTLGGALDTTEAGRLDTAIANAGTAGLKVIIDVHNYASYYTTGGRNLIGGGTVTQAHFVDLWTKLSTRYKANANVLGYDLCNEPIDCGESTWEAASQAAVTAIRANSDTKLIFVETYDFAQVDSFSWGGHAAGPWITGATGIIYSAHHYFEPGADYDITYAANVANASAEGYSSFIEGIPPGQTYHWRLAAQNADGVTYSPDQVSIAGGGVPGTGGGGGSSGTGGTGVVGGEGIVLDPTEVAVNRIQLDITQLIADAGPDWGDAAIEQAMGDAEIGSVPIDFRIPNRTITIPLLLRDLPAGLTFNEARKQLQQKTAIFQRQGGWIKRSTTLGSLFADIVGAQLKLGGSTAQALWGIDADAVLTLTALPDFYGNEFAGAVHASTSTQAELIYVLDNPVTGDYPARTRIIVNELDGISQHGLLWGIRSQDYSVATTARLAYEAGALTPMGGAVSQSFAAASGGTEISLAALPNIYTPILSTDIAGTGGMTHTGSYRVWARMRSDSTPSVRFVWDVGDLTMPVTNNPVTLPVTGATYALVDLGEIRIDPAPIGTHRWGGVVQGVNPGATCTLAIDKLWLQPLEVSGRLSASPVVTLGMTGYSAFDGFEQVGTTLTGKALAIPSGSNWTYARGPANDFALSPAQRYVTRSAANDPVAPEGAVVSGRIMVASGVSLSTVGAQVAFFHTDPSSGSFGGGSQNTILVFRYVDSSNFGYVTVTRSGSDPLLTMGYVTSGTANSLSSLVIPNYYSVWHWLRVIALPTGEIFAWAFPTTYAVPIAPTVQRTDSRAINVFGPGGALASGAVGFGDYYSSTPAPTRYYDSFSAWVPEIDAVLYPNRSAELRFDGMFREGTGGTTGVNSSFAPISTVVGDLPRIPASGLENRKVEIFLKASVGDLGVNADSAISALSAQIKYRPTYLFVPE